MTGVDIGEKRAGTRAICGAPAEADTREEGKRVTDAAIVEQVTEDFARRQRERRAYEAKWLLNMNFLAGNQYRTVSARGELDYEPRSYPWEKRECYNHIAPIVETRLAKLARVRPLLTVRAATGDEEDTLAARLATKILRGALAEAGITETINEATKWSETCGTSFYKVTWDPEAGARLAEDAHEGDVALSAVPPFEIYPYSACCEKLDDQPSILHARCCTAAEIEDAWGVKTEGRELDVYTFEAVEGRGSAGARKTLESAAVVLERYERPTRARPEGRLTIVAGEALVYDGPLPYADPFTGARGYPFVKQCSVSLPGCFWGSSIIERLIPVQRAYNAVKNRKYEFMNRVAFGVLAVEDGSVDTDNLECEGLPPGKVLVYRQGAAPPRELPAASVPLDFVREEERLLSEFILISGVSDLMRSSQAYSENASGVALQLLAEQDDTRLLVTVDSVRSAVKEAAKKVLHLYKQFAVTPRLLRAAGENGEVEVVAFAASSVTSDDIVFETENELAATPAQRRSMAMELLSAGLLTDENGRLSARMRARLLDLLGFSQLAGDVTEGGNGTGEDIG